MTSHKKNVHLLNVALYSMLRTALFALLFCSFTLHSLGLNPSLHWRKPLQVPLQCVEGFRVGLKPAFHSLSRCQGIVFDINYQNAEQDFEVFWTTFRDNYAFFKLKGVDWDATYKKYRPLVNSNTTQAELFEILRQMVEPLNDGHISISNKDKIIYKGRAKSVFREEFGNLATAQQLWKVSFGTLKKQGFAQIDSIGPIFQNESLFYFSKTPQVGFLRISRCFADAKGVAGGAKEEEKDRKTMLKLLDEVLSQLQNTEKLIIDLRANPGGHSGEWMASRFVSEKRLTHYKKIRQVGGYESFTDFQPFYISPNDGINYKKPIIILTNDKTASAAEDFVVSLYQQPNTITIGTNTAGMLSDIFEGKLSKKVSFSLSNQRYFSATKELLEEAGVPVKIPLTNTRKDIETQTDPLILRALEEAQR